MNNDTFPTSGYPNYLEAYVCYHDPSKDHYRIIDGMELKNNIKWDEEAQKRWLFFYRPQKEFVGRPQKNLIAKSREKIENYKKELNSLYFILIIFAFPIILLVLISYHYQHLKISLFINIIYWLFSGGSYFTIISNYSKIKKEKKKIKEYNDEILQLIKQIPNEYLDEIEIENYFISTLQKKEIESLNDILDEPVNSENIKDFIDLKKGFDSKFHGIMMKGWAFLQPLEIIDSSGFKQTGLNRFINDIGSNITTWYEIDNENSYIAPYFYRAWYIQFIYLLDDNISTYSFFYDFISEEKYGKRSETFRYQHVANFSINETELNEPTLFEVIKKADSKNKSPFEEKNDEEKNEQLLSKERISQKLIDIFYKEEVHAITLSVSSGVHLRCVLTGNSVIEGMHDWSNNISSRTRRQTNDINLTEDEVIAYKALKHIRSSINDILR